MRGGDRRVLGAELGDLLGEGESQRKKPGTGDHMVSMKDDYHWPGEWMEATQETQNDAVEGSR